MYGTSGLPVQMHRQFSEQLHPPNTPSHAQMRPPDTQDHGQPLQNYFGITAFSRYEQSETPSAPTLRHPESTTPSRGFEQSEPSLHLRLEQPEPYPGTFALEQLQRQYQQHVSALSTQMQQSSFQPLRPLDVRSFDLEQPSESMEQLEQAANLIGTGPASQAVEQQESTELTGTNLFQQNQERQVYETSFAQNGFTIGKGREPVPQLIRASAYFPMHQRNQQVYPESLATHNAVVEDRQLFGYTLDNFLAALGTRLTLPKIGGRDLDLHLLYKEVTARGGLEQVIRYARWKEIIEAMDVLVNYPSASFVLRKHYINLLYHYEQSYYFGIRGQLLSPPAPLPAPNPVQLPVENGSPYDIPAGPESAFKKRKRKINPSQIFGVDPAASLGNTVTGVINGKFEEGYIVTVVVGAERLTGVLYHVASDTNIPQFASVPGLLDAVGSEIEVPGLEVQLQGKRKKESSYKKDPNAPRRTRTGYNIFYKEHRVKLKQLHPEKDKDITRMVIEMWSQLPEEEKSLYVERGQQDRERFRREMSEYQERLKLQSQSFEEDTSAQPLAEHDLGSYDGSHDYHVSLEAEADLSTLHGGQTHVSESGGLCGSLTAEQDYAAHEDGLAYHVSVMPQAQFHDSEAAGVPGESGQAYQMQHDDDDNDEYAEEPESGEEGDPTAEQAYAADEDEAAYPSPEQEGYHMQGDVTGYPDSQQAYHMQEDGRRYASHLSESEGQDGSGPSNQPYYVQQHEYAYPHLRQQQEPDSEAAGGLVSEQVEYEVQQNGQTYHSQVPQSQQEVAGGSVSEQQFYTRDGYVYTHMRQAQAVESEALGVPASEQTYRGQEDGPYSAHLPHQNQVLESGVQGRQVPTEQVYQERYPNPSHLSYPQAYSLPQAHGYPMHFSHVYPYPLHLPEAQALQYGHAYATHLHQPQALPPEVSGGPVSSQQLYRVQDGGQTYVQEDGQTMPIYKHGAYG